MRLQGTATVADFMGELIVYRRLEPADRRVPGLKALASGLGLADHDLPRKADAAYARVVQRIMRSAHAMNGASHPLRHLIYVGDSPSLDLAAFRNLLAEAGWKGWVFIGSDAVAEPRALQFDGNQCRGNRWGMLADFLAWCRNDGATIDESLAVVVDLDKTILGPRGRNDHTIDDARTEAGSRVARAALGDRFSEQVFGRMYRELQQSKYHFFTEDNQDFLVYTTLLLAAGVCGFEELLEDLRERRIATFRQFLDFTDPLGDPREPDGLRAIRREVSANFRAGDPTPFKTFRQEEFRTTVARMNPNVEGADLGQILRERITINFEVVQLVRFLRRQGALALGLSDKPDEAVYPTPELAAEGFRPLHNIATVAVGETLNLV